MTEPKDTHCIAFDGATAIAAGRLDAVARAAKARLDADPTARILIFTQATSAPIDLDFRGSIEDVLARLGPEAGEADPTPAKAGERGRPKLGVVGREVTLLPRHWAWLQSQPGGASVALRKLVETAMRDTSASLEKRQARDAAYRFMSAMAGDLPGFEEAARALFSEARDRFFDLVGAWPPDIRKHLIELATPSFSKEAPSP